MKPTPAPLGLYLHIPFCRSKCVYCDFYSLPRSEDRMDAYADALCAHLTETAPFAANHLVDTVYFGGGTPSYLGAKRLAKILKVILKKFRVAKDAEITLEANPDSAGDWKALRTLRKCGFNRISLGMQSADDTELAEIGRVHTMAQVSAAVEAAVSGVTDKMVAFQCTREGGKYTCEPVLQPLDIVANFEKKVPREWINAAGNGVEQPFIDYVLPLIQGEPDRPKENALPRFAKLKKVLTTDM